VSGYGVSRTGISLNFASTIFSWVYYNHSHAYFGAKTLWGSNMAMTKAIWQKAKKYTVNGINLHEDQDLALAIASVGGKIHIMSSLVVSVDFNDIQYFEKYQRYNIMKRNIKLVDKAHPRYNTPQRHHTNWPKRALLHAITIEFVYLHYLISLLNSTSKLLIDYSKLARIYNWYKNI
jgi:hypothetical protein